MGKPNKTGTRVNYILPPDEEKKRLRNSILAVFRSHFQKEENSRSVIKPDASGIKKRRKKFPSVKHHYTSDDSESIMGSQEDTIKRKRKRKTKTERNKTRSKSACSQEVEGKVEVNKHIRTAHSVLYPLRSKGPSQEDDRSCVITQNRLTKRLGLFNKSKKSSNISREPLVLSESIRKETEDDLKKILDINEGVSEVAMETDHGLRGDTSIQGESNSSIVITKAKFTPRSLIASRHSHTVSSTSTGISTCPSSVEVDDFPETPPMEEIVQELAGRLEDHKIFKGRDMAKELSDDLNKLMKHNEPRDTTPASTKVPPCVSTSSGSSVCRSLLSSFTPQSRGSHHSVNSVVRRDSKLKTVSKIEPIAVQLSDQPKSYPPFRQVAVPNLQPYHPNSSVGHTSSNVSVCNASSIKDLALIAQIENIASRVKKSFKTSSDLDQIRMNAMEILKLNDQMSLKQEIASTISNPSTLKTQPMTQALDLLVQNDKVSESRMRQQVAVSNKENVNAVQGDFLPYRGFSSQEHLTNSQSSGFHSHHSCDLTMKNPILDDHVFASDLSSQERSRSMYRGVTEHDNSQDIDKAVLAEYCTDTQYMPKFHGDFYKDSLWFEKTILSNIEQVPDLQSQQCAKTETDTSSMDILDYLDQNSQASMDILSHSGHSSNQSPDWRSSTNPYRLPPKPVSPDSPQMFPRRLY